MKKKSLGIVNLSDSKNPKIDLVSKKSFQEDLNLFKDGQRVWLITESYSPKRSLQANSLWHLWIGEISQECGQDADDVKSTLKTMFAQYPLLDSNGEDQFNPSTGERLMFVKDTSAMSKAEMSDLMEKTQLFALEFWNMQLVSEGDQAPLKFKENY